MTPPSWIHAALRSVVWLGGAACLAYLKKPDGSSILAVRADAIGWLGGGIFLAGLALHVWSNAILARGERYRSEEANALVTDGPFRYVRNPIYLAGITLLLGVDLLYYPWNGLGLMAPAFLLAFFHLRVVRVEEPLLRRRFGARYGEYCRRVPRWIPVPGSLARAAQETKESHET